jgi:hypothetical protein
MSESIRAGGVDGFNIWALHQIRSSEWQNGRDSTMGSEVRVLGNQFISTSLGIIFQGFRLATWEHLAG